MKIDNTAIVNKYCTIRYLDYLVVGAYSIIDNYCYFSTKVELGDFCHIGPNCTFGGGNKYTIFIGDHTGISSGVRIYTCSDDFVNDLIGIYPKIDRNYIKGNVRFMGINGVGANTVIMPNNDIPEGVAIGAMSFVPTNFKFEPWSVYFGVPIKKLCSRNKKNVLRQMELSLEWKSLQKKII